MNNSSTARGLVLAAAFGAATLAACGGGGNDAAVGAAPEAATFTPLAIQLYRPNFDPLAVYGRWAVTVEGAGSNYPYTLEVFFNGQSQGVKRPGDDEVLGSINHSANLRYAYIYPITGYAAGPYEVRAIVRAAGQSAEKAENFVFPPCDPAGTPAASALRTCPPS